MPVLSRSRRGRTKPASASISSITLRLGQVGDRLRQVAVGGAVGQQGADARDDLAEVDAVAPRAAPGWAARPPRAARCGRPGAPPGPARRRTPRGPRSCAGRSRTWRRPTDAVGHREAQHVGVDERSARAGRGQHPEREVDADGAEVRCRQLAAEVAGAAGQVEHPGAGREVEPGRPCVRRQPTSMRNVMSRFTRSYRGAIVSNIARTARTFSSPCGSVAVMTSGGGSRASRPAHGWSRRAAPAGSSGRSPR